MNSFRSASLRLRARLVVPAAIAALAMVTLVPAAARADPDTEQAVLLVAHPEMTDPVWSQTVLLAAPAPSGFHIGLIVNRPTERSLASLFPEHEPSRKVVDPIHFGGPVSANAVVALVKAAASPGGTTLRFSNGLYLALDAPTVDRVIESTPDNARFYVGFVVWRPGELEEEIRAGYWNVLDADSAIVFRKDTEGLWRELRRGGQALTAALEPERAAR
jgi:putative transcriptional regulator